MEAENKKVREFSEDEFVLINLALSVLCDRTLIDILEALLGIGKVLYFNAEKKEQFEKLSTQDKLYGNDNMGVPVSQLGFQVPEININN